MTTATNAPLLPKYFKGRDGFCYNATPQLVGAGLMPWNGAVDERGFAKPTLRPEPEPEVESRSRSLRKRLSVQAPAPEAPAPAAADDSE